MAERLIFATTNPAKLGQMRYVVEFYQFPVLVIPAADLVGEAAEYEETGRSAAEIARNGAVEVAERTGLPVMTEDSTFGVAALNGDPGTRAGAFLKECGRRALLEALGANRDRRAWVSSAVAFAAPAESPLVLARTLTGTITRQERWASDMPDWVAPTPESPLGGGFNAVFCLQGERRTLAEIPPQEGLHKGYREPLFYALLGWLLKQRQS